MHCHQLTHENVFFDSQLTSTTIVYVNTLYMCVGFGMFV